MSFCKNSLCDCLSDGALPRPCESVQPVDRGLVKVACPAFDLVENGNTGPFETTLTVAVLILGLSRGAKISEDSGFSCQKEFCEAGVIGNKEAGGILTRVLKREVISLTQK